MDTLIRIRKDALPKLLSKLGEAMSKGVDLEISESSNRQYLKIGDSPKELLDCKNIKIETELQGFTQEEIKEMEETKDCPVYGKIDLYSCKYLCELKRSCEL